MKFNRICASILIGTMMLSGCGASAGSFVFTPTSASRVDQPFAGQLFLGTGIGDIPVSVETLDGQVVATSRTNATGSYLFVDPLPTDFRVVARVSEELAFSREIRNFGSQPTFGAITIPTTLVSRLAQARPGETVDGLENDVRAALRLPSDAQLDELDESVSEDFSHLAFFVRAARNGGVKAYLESLANGEAADEAFVLRADSLNLPSGALDPKLAEPLQRFAGSQKVRLSTRRLLSRGAFDGRVSVANGTSSTGVSGEIRGQFGEVAAVVSIALAVGIAAVNGAAQAFIISDQRDASQLAATWAVAALEARFDGVERSLSELSDQISGVQQTVDQIIATINYDNMQDVIRRANGFEDSIQLQQNRYLQAIIDALGTPNYFSGEPSTLPNNVANVVATLRTDQTMLDLQNQVNQLQGLLAGADGVPQSSGQIEYQPIVVDANSTSNPGAARPNLVLIERDNVLSSFSIPPADSWERFGFFPYRSAALLDEATGSCEAYTSSQILGCNLIGEAAHLSANPQQAIPRAVAYIENTYRSLLNVRAQLPSYPLSDNYFVDLPNGLIWYTVLQAPVSDPAAFARAFDDGKTTGWRTPSREEMEALLAAGGLANPEKLPGGPLGEPTGGLERLGFDLTALGADNLIEAPSYSLLTTNGYYDVNPNEYLRVDLTSVGLLDNSIGFGFDFISDSTDPLPFFMCRTIGPTPVNQILAGENQNVIENSWPPYFSVTLTDEEIPTLGAFRGFTEVSIQNLQARLKGDWDVYVGGLSAFEFARFGFDDESNNVPLQTLSRAVSGAPPTYFLTNDNAGSTVSNNPGTYGVVTPRVNADQETTIKASTLGFSGSKFPVVMSDTVSFSLPAPQQVRLSELTVMPLNIAISSAGQNASQQFLGQGYFDDKTFQDLTQRTTWTVIDEDTGQAPVAASLSASTPGLLLITNDPNGSINLIVTGTVELSGNPSGSQTTTSRVRVIR
jgi:hypothetical protein